MKSLLATMVCLLLASTGAAYGQLINFDDIEFSGLAITSVMPSGYQGLNWSNFWVLDGLGEEAAFGPNGYLYGIVSSPNVAVNSNGEQASISAGNGFTLNSGEFTSAWNDGLALRVIGRNGASTVFDNSYTLDTFEPTLIQFPNVLVTEVDFESSGGVPAGYSGGGTNFALDNLMVTPSAPALAIAQAGGGVMISWPSSSAGYLLQTSSNLAATNWGVFTGTIATNSDGTTNSTTITVSTGNLFFRLASP